MSIKLMQRAWDTSLPTTRKFVLVSLADQANDQGECFPSIQTVMTRCSLSRRAVFDALRELEDEGFLTRSLRPGRGTLFYITDPCNWRTGAGGALVQKAHQCINRTGAPNAQGGAPGAPRGAAGALQSAPRALPIKQPPTNPHLIPTEPPPGASERDQFDGHDRDQVPDSGREFEMLDDYEQELIRPVLGEATAKAKVKLKLLADFIDHAKQKRGVTISAGWYTQLRLQIAQLWLDGHDVNKSLEKTIQVGNCVQLLIPKAPGTGPPGKTSGVAQDFDNVDYG